MRKLSASVRDKDVLFGFDSNPDGRIGSKWEHVHLCFGLRTYIRNAGPIAGMTLIIKRDGTVLVEKLTHHGLPFSLLSETKSGSLRRDIFEEVSAILSENAYTLGGRFGCASWMGWPLIIAYNGHLHALDLEGYAQSKNNLKPIIHRLIPLLRETGIAVLPEDFFC